MDDGSAVTDLETGVSGAIFKKLWKMTTQSENWYHNIGSEDQPP